MLYFAIYKNKTNNVIIAPLMPPPNMPPSKPIKNVFKVFLLPVFRLALGDKLDIIAF